MSGIIHANGVIGLRDRLGPPGSAADDPEAPKEGWHGRVQLRRENVERETSEETTEDGDAGNTCVDIAKR